MECFVGVCFSSRAPGFRVVALSNTPSPPRLEPESLLHTMQRPGLSRAAEGLVRVQMGCDFR